MGCSMPLALVLVLVPCFGDMLGNIALSAHKLDAGGYQAKYIVRRALLNNQFFV